MKRCSAALHDAYTTSPAVLFTVAPQMLPSGESFSAKTWPWVSVRRASGSPVTAPVSFDSRTATVFLVLTRLTMTVSSVATQPATPGRSGQLHTVDTLESLVIRCSRSPVGVRSVTYKEPLAPSMHSPPPEPMPDSAVVGGAWPTVVGCSMRSSLPASEAGSAAAAGLPASPVSTIRVVGLVKIKAPILPTGPFGMPVRIGLGTSPSAMRITRLSVGVLM